jgi:hypothetical protein
MRRTRLIIAAVLLVLGIVYVAGLSYCASIYGFGCYGANWGPAPAIPPSSLQRIYNPSLYTVAAYQKWRARSGYDCCDPPLDIKILERILFVRAWGAPACTRQKRTPRPAKTSSP